MAAVAGDVRRWKEIVARVEVVAATRDLEASHRALASYPEAARVTRDAHDTVTMWLDSGARARVRLVAPARFGAALFHATGSDAHVKRIESMIDGELPEGVAEDDVYRLARVAPIPPELREDVGEVEAALGGDAFDDLVTASDVRGMVHCHTVYSDGRATVLEMAREAEAMGMEYLTITDHSPTAHYAGGVSIDRLKELWDEIAEAQEKVDVRILRGTESDILADGTLDYPDSILEQLDVVIASIHARYRMDENAMTERILRALALPIRKIWGHPLGRLVLHRPPIACRMPEILDCAARSNVVIEINGDPHRLDLPPEWIREARMRGIPFVVSVDAHSRRGMHTLPFAIAMARRGGVRRRELVNARDVHDFLEAVAPGATQRGRDAPFRRDGFELPRP